METKFEGTWGGVFVTVFVGGLLCIIPFVGVALGWIHIQKYMVSQTVIGGKRLEFKATLGEVWGSIFITGLLSWIPGLAAYRMEKLKYNHISVIG